MTTSRRYRLKEATWIVNRTDDEPSPRQLKSVAALTLLARDLVAAHDDDKEHFWIVLVDHRLQYLMHSMVSMGIQNQSVVHPREIFGPALREGAAGIFLIHNHPAGDPAPSLEDIRFTRQMADVAAIVGIVLHDHLIIGNSTYACVSMHENNHLTRTGNVVEIGTYILHAAKENA